MTIQELNRQPRPFTRGTHSPCIGVCVLDAAHGTCQGCGRTGDEIGAWATASRAEQEAAWDAMPNRLQRSSRNSDVLQLRPWSAAGILEFAERGILDHATGGSWTICGFKVPNSPDGAEVARGDDQLVVVGHTYRFRLKAHEKLRAFAFGPALAPTNTILTLPKGRVALPTNETPTWYPTDDNAIDPATSSHGLLDLGVMQDGVRLSLRSQAEPSSPSRGDTSSSAWELALAGPTSSDLIVETQCARLEQPLTSALADYVLRQRQAPAPSTANLPGWAAVMACHVSSHLHAST